MKRWTGLAALTVGLAATLGAGSMAIAKPAKEAVPQVDIGRLQIAPEAEAVESFSMLGGPHSWTAVDKDTVIVWATAFRPYLIELAFPAHDLPFAHVIGVTSFGSRVYAKFDSVKIGGFRYPIDAIYEISRDEARNWKANARES